MQDNQESGQPPPPETPKNKNIIIDTMGQEQLVQVPEQDNTPEADINQIQLEIPQNIRSKSLERKQKGQPRQGTSGKKILHQ